MYCSLPINAVIRKGMQATAAARRVIVDFREQNGQARQRLGLKSVLITEFTQITVRKSRNQNEDAAWKRRNWQGNVWQENNFKTCSFPDSPAQHSSAKPSQWLIRFLQ